MNTHRWLGIVLAPLLLAGCNAIGMKGSPMWHRTASNDVKKEHFENICRSYGFRVGTEEMRNCISEEWRSSKVSANKRTQAMLSRPEPSSSSTTNIYNVTVEPEVCKNGRVMTQYGCRYR